MSNQNGNQKLESEMRNEKSVAGAEFGYSGRQVAQGEILKLFDDGVRAGPSAAEAVSPEKDDLFPEFALVTQVNCYPARVVPLELGNVGDLGKRNGDLAAVV